LHGNQNRYLFMQRTLPPDFIHSDVSASRTSKPSAQLLVHSMSTALDNDVLTEEGSGVTSHPGGVLFIDLNHALEHEPDRLQTFGRKRGRIDQHHLLIERAKARIQMVEPWFAQPERNHQNIQDACKRS
jgi:hypothetical protein